MPSAQTKESAPGVLKQFEELVGPEEIIEAACRLGVIKRQRKVDMPALVQATITAMLPVPGTQTTVLDNYVWLTGQQLAHSAFYDRFTDEFGALMRELAGRVVAKVREVAPEDACAKHFGVLLERFKDVQAADSTCHILKRLGRDWAPSTSKVRPAGVKFHAVVSLKDGLPVVDGISPQRMHDNKGLPEEALTPGTLTLMDLGYLDVDRFIDAIESGAAFLTRLKQSHDPIIHRVHVGKGDKRRARGMRLDEAFEADVLEEDKGLVDLDVELVHGSRRAVARVVAVRVDGERHWYLTSVSRETLPPEDVSEAYRLRWYVELIFKQLKSGAGLKAILAWRPGAVEALIYSKVIALCLARLLELAVTEDPNRRVTTQLALVLALTRCSPMLLSFFGRGRGITVEQMEERILIIARMAAKSRNQRRERAKRKREQALGRGS